MIPYLEVTGSPLKIGYNIGKTFKTNIVNILAEFSDFRKHKAVYSQKRNLIEEMLKISRKACPDIVDEIEGMADGAQVNFDDLFIHNCMHMPHWASCSTSIMRNNETIFIAHNEDAHPLLEKYSYFVLVRPNNSVPFFSHCYPGVIPGMSYGFNLAGIVQTCNSLPDPIKSVGIPRMFVGRTIHEKAHTIEEAIGIIQKMQPRSGGASYSLGSQSELNIVNVETTGTDYSVIPIRRYFFRANHYISDKFVKHPAASKHTLTRQERGDVKLPSVKNSSELLDVMWDNSIYLTMEGTNNECQTNSTVIFEISEENIILKKYDGKGEHIFKRIDLLRIK